METRSELDFATERESERNEYEKNRMADGHTLYRDGSDVYDVIGDLFP